MGSVYDAFNFGNGYENVYTAIPGANGAPDTVTDTLVTPFGNINLDSLFGGIDAAAPLSPGDAFTGLEAGDSSIGADAFSIGDTTFDPTLAAGGEGFDPVVQLTRCSAVVADRRRHAQPWRGLWFGTACGAGLQRLRRHRNGRH